jgi:hypothetical protein
MHEPSLGVSSGKLRPLFDAAIDELNEKDRAAIVLRFFSQLSLAQVGAALRVSEDAARMRVDRALLKLQSVFTRRGITSTGAALSAALANEALLAAPEGIAARVCGGAMSVAGTAASGTAVTIGFMSFMKTMVTGAALLAALGVASFQIANWRAAVAERADAERAMTTATERARTAEAEAQKAEHALTAVQQQLTALRSEKSNRAQAAAAVTSPSVNGPAAGPWDERAEGTAFMNRHTEVKDALRDYVRARAQFSYGPLLDSLTLTPEQRERLEMYLMGGAGMGAPVPGAPSDEHQLTLSLTGNKNTGGEEQWLKDTLGPDGMRLLNEYRKQMNTRDDAVGVAGALWDSDSPLTAAQAAQLATVFASHRTVVNRQQVYDWNGITSATSSFLSPSQMNAIEALRTQAQFNAILSRPVAVTPVTTASQTPHP